MTAVRRRLFGGFASVLSFLTILPVPQSAAPPPAPPAAGTPADDPDVPLRGVAGSMHLFPVAGAATGLGLGLLAWGLFEVAEPLLAGLLAAAAILLLAGLHHTDGLSDLADGLMARGTRARRLAAMKDRSTGTAGTAAIALCVTGLIITLSLAGGREGHQIVVGVLLGEMLAKFSMVVMAAVGSSATGRGSGALFVGAMRDRRKVAAAASVSVLIAVLLGGLAGLAMLAAAVGTAAILAGLSARIFGGVTGDVFGATNDLARLASLAVFFSI